MNGPNKSIVLRKKDNESVVFGGRNFEDDRSMAFESFKFFRKSASRARRDRVREGNSDIITKDARRTFQAENFFKNTPIQRFLILVLELLTDRHPEIGYVQGMNYLAGTVTFHCAHQHHVLRVLSFLFENFEMRKVYNFSTFETHLAVLKMLFKCHLLEFFFYFDQVIRVDFRIMLVDWFFCLGLNKVPLAHSARFLGLLVRHGWYFFFRFLVCYFRLFESLKRGKFLLAKTVQTKFELEVELKNFFKEKIDWAKLMNEARAFDLRDEIVDEYLGWSHRGCFRRLKQ